MSAARGAVNWRVGEGGDVRDGPTRRDVKRERE